MKKIIYFTFLTAGLFLFNNNVYSQANNGNSIPNLVGDVGDITGGGNLVDPCYDGQSALEISYNAPPYTFQNEVITEVNITVQDCDNGSTYTGHSINFTPGEFVAGSAIIPFNYFQINDNNEPTYSAGEYKKVCATVTLYFESGNSVLQTIEILVPMCG